MKLLTNSFDNIIHGSYLRQLQTLASLLPQEKSVMIQSIKNVNNVTYLNTCHCYYTLTSFCIPIFCLFLLRFFLLSSGNKQTRLWAFFSSYQKSVIIKVNPSIQLGWDWPLPSFHCQSLFTFKEYASCYDENKHCEFVNKNNLILMCFLSRKIFKWFPSSLTQWVTNPFDKKFFPPLFVNMHFDNLLHIELPNRLLPWCQQFAQVASASWMPFFPHLWYLSSYVWIGWQIRVLLYGKEMFLWVDNLLTRSRWKRDRSISFFV